MWIGTSEGTMDMGGKQLQDLPRNATVIVGTDANGHVGSVRTLDEKQNPKDVEDHVRGLEGDRVYGGEKAEYCHIGPYGKEKKTGTGGSSGCS
jgi:hypothetical protein